MKDILLHQKHGLAPALTFCRVCGKECNEIALLGAKADRVMEELYSATNGKHGSARGYQPYGFNRIPSSEPCDDCKKILTEGGAIFVGKDTKQYLRLDKKTLDGLVGRIADGKGRVLDLNFYRGKVHYLNKAFWVTDDKGNVLLRNPDEWTK